MVYLLLRRTLRRRHHVAPHLAEGIVLDAHAPLRTPLEIAGQHVGEGSRALDSDDILDEERNRAERRPAAEVAPDELAGLRGDRGLVLRRRIALPDRMRLELGISALHHLDNLAANGARRAEIPVRIRRLDRIGAVQVDRGQFILLDNIIVSYPALGRIRLVSLLLSMRRRRRYL